MVDDPSGGGTQKATDDGVANAEPAADLKDAPPLGTHQERGTDGSEKGRQKSDKGAGTFLGRLTVSEWLTFLVGVGSLCVALLTYLNAADTRDIKQAVRGLATLAAQTKRAADNTHDQLGAMKDQVGAMRDQVGALKDQAAEAKRQTKAISGQTTAIKASSDANIRSSQAQQRMADVTAKAQIPKVEMNTLHLTGFQGKPNEKGEVHIFMRWEFRNEGGGYFKSKAVKIGLYIGDSLPPAPPPILFNIAGNDLIVTTNINSGLNNIALNDIALQKSGVDAIEAGKINLFVFGSVDYEDPLGVAHEKCFAYKMTIVNDESTYWQPAGGPAYHCEI